MAKRVKEPTGSIDLDTVIPGGSTIREALENVGSGVPQTEPPLPSPPGDTLAGLMDENGLSVEECAHCCDLAPEVIQGVVEGWLPVDEDIADGLASHFMPKADFWLRREHGYEESLEYHGETRAVPPMWARQAAV